MRLVKYAKFNHTKGIYLHRILAAICSSIQYTGFSILQMRVITFIHCICPVLANFIQGVDLSDRQGKIGKEIKQKESPSLWHTELYFLCKSGFWNSNLRKNTISKWLVLRQALCNECKNDKTEKHSRQMKLWHYFCTCTVRTTAFVMYKMTKCCLRLMNFTVSCSVVVFHACFSLIMMS